MAERLNNGRFKPAAPDRIAPHGRGPVLAELRQMRQLLEWYIYEQSGQGQLGRTLTEFTARVYAGAVGAAPGEPDAR